LSDVNLETFVLFLSHTPARLWNLDLSFASCTSCTSAMHDITQLWGMCIIGKEEEKYLFVQRRVQISVLLKCVRCICVFCVWVHG